MKTTAKLPRTQDNSARLDQKVEHFVHCITHDIRTPLRAIACFSELLSKHQTNQIDPKTRYYLDYILDNTAKLEAMLDAVKDYSRSNGKGQMQPEHLAHMAQRCVEVMQTSPALHSHLMDKDSSVAAIAKDYQPIHMLLVEDTDSDVALMREIIDSTGITCQLDVISRGSEVLDYLREGESPKPDLIVLDLGLPDQDGFSILEELTKLPRPMREIPIIILTGYDQFNYIGENYNLWIAAYITKPCSISKLQKILQGIAQSERGATM